MWRQNGSGSGHSARAPTGSPPRLPGAFAGAGASRAAVAAATGVLAAASAEAAPPLSQARTAALGAANRRVRLRSDGSSPKKGLSGSSPPLRGCRGSGDKNLGLFAASPPAAHQPGQYTILGRLMADSPPGGMIPLKRWEITSLVGVGRHLVVV